MLINFIFFNFINWKSEIVVGTLTQKRTTAFNMTFWSNGRILCKSRYQISSFNRNTWCAWHFLKVFSFFRCLHSYFGRLRFCRLTDCFCGKLWKRNIKRHFLTDLFLKFKTWRCQITVKLQLLVQEYPELVSSVLKVFLTKPFSAWKTVQSYFLFAC